MFGVAFKLRVVDEKPQLEIQHPYLKLQSLDVTVKHNSYANILNTLLKWMNPMICHQLEKTVTSMIIEKSAALLTPVNNLAIQYWPMLNQMVDTTAIVKGKERVDKDGKVINRDLSKELAEIEVEFMDGPLGLDLYESYPTEPAVCKVKRFNHGPRNSRLQAERSHLIKPHDYIIAINGVDVTTMDYDKIIEMLGSVVRPLIFGREIMSDAEKNSDDYDSSDSDSESEEKPKKKSKKAKKESSSSDESSSESEEKPKKKSKKAKKESSSSSESESEEEKPKKKAAKKEESSSSEFTESSESEEEKPKKKAAKKESSSSSSSSSESEEEKPKKKAAKKESSSSSSSSESEEEKPKKTPKKEVLLAISLRLRKARMRNLLRSLLRRNLVLPAAVQKVRMRNLLRNPLRSLLRRNLALPAAVVRRVRKRSPRRRLPRRNLALLAAVVRKVRRRNPRRSLLRSLQRNRRRNRAAPVRKAINFSICFRVELFVQNAL